MQLENFLLNNLTASLTTIREESETTQRMISNSTTRLYLDATGLLLTVVDVAAGKWDIEVLVEGVGTGEFTPHPAKATCLLIVKTLEGSSKDDDDFNFMIGTVKGDGVIAKTEELRDVTLPEFSAEIGTFLALSIAHCNVVTYPFAEVTAGQHAEALTKIALIGKLDSHTTYYHGVPDSENPEGSIVKGNDQVLCINVSYDEILPVAATGTLMSKSFDPTLNEWVPNTLTTPMRFPVGGKTRQHRVGTTQRERVFARKTKYWFESDINLPSKVTVIGG